MLLDIWIRRSWASDALHGQADRPRCTICSMAITFKSPVTGDLIMLQAHARALLGILGKDPEQPGIFRVDDMPLFITLLKGLPDEPTEELQAEGEADDKGQDKATPKDTVSLRKRAWPLVQMMERCQAAGKDIVWGV